MSRSLLDITGSVSLPIPTTAGVLSRLRNGIFNCFSEQLAGFVFALGIPPETDRKDPWQVWPKDLRCNMVRLVSVMPMIEGTQVGKVWNGFRE